MPQNIGYLTADTTTAGDERFTPYYAVEPLLEFLPPAAKFSWYAGLFTPNEFHLYGTPVPVSSVSFDDLLKGGI